MHRESPCLPFAVNFHPQFEEDSARNRYRLQPTRRFRETYSVLSGACCRQTPSPPTSRAQATAIIANARKIVTPNGVERLQKVRIGGIDQWVSIRGADRRNPVLIVLHGGPGYVSMPMPHPSGLRVRFFEFC